jgi:acid phosphatase (class A)
MTRMLTRNLILPLCLAAAAFALPLAAPFALAEEPTPTFVSPQEFAPLDMLPLPPAADSTTEKSELAKLDQIEDARTPADVDHARADEAERDIFIFKNVLGEGFNAEALPQTAALSAHVEADMLADAEPVKDIFKRVRPYNIDKSLHPVCVLKTKNDSYPSGHTMTGYLMALVLSSMLPEKRDAIFARADDYAHNRLVCGVHHPSDLESGKEIAYGLYAVMADNPRFQAERAAAEAEIRRALALPAPANGADHAAAQ